MTRGELLRLLEDNARRQNQNGLDPMWPLLAFLLSTLAVVLVLLSLTAAGVIGAGA